MSAKTRPADPGARDPALEAALADALGGGSCRGAPQRSSSRRTIAVVGCGPVGPRSAPPAAVVVATPAIYAYQRVGSTMEVAHDLAAGGAPEGTLIFAARQEQGRGRLGRVWHSPEGGAYCSIILRPLRPTSEIPQLSLVAGLAVAETIRELTNTSPAIRWPNDVLVDGLKVAGILTESRSTNHDPRPSVVIGIGINVSTDPAGLPPNSTSLKKCQTLFGLFRPFKVSDTSTVAAEVYRRLMQWYHVWSRQGFAPIRQALRPWMGGFGQPVSITAGADQFTGTASDLDESGRLLVRLDHGILRPFDMGEVTLLRPHA